MSDEEILKAVANELKMYGDFDNIDYLIPQLGQAIENILEENKELEEKNKKKSIEIICYQEELENSIPVSLVEETIEELNRKIKYEDNEKVIIWLHKQRKILQELVERKK